MGVRSNQSDTSSCGSWADPFDPSTGPLAIHYYSGDTDRRGTPGRHVAGLRKVGEHGLKLRQGGAHLVGHGLG